MHEFPMLTSRQGYTPETDAVTGKEKWPVGDEKAWKDGIPALTTGEYCLDIVEDAERAEHER